jgi:hypothetical protein
MSWTTNDEVLHIKGLPERAKYMSQQHGVTIGGYIRAYATSLKLRENWDGIEKPVVLYEMGRVLGSLKKK